jgi:hypothetical protein
MASLNRFPLLGLWAREAALRIGFSEAEADTIGHAYAVLYAIRSNSTARPAAKIKDPDAAKAIAEANAEPADIEHLNFGDDHLQVSHNTRGQLIGRVGNATPQTPETYRYKVVSKFPAGSHDKVREAFRAYFQQYTPQKLDTRLIYTLYDTWKKSCASGRLVDLDKLIQWCHDRTPAAKG